MNIELTFQIAAGIQLGIAILNLFLVSMMKWKEDLQQLPLLIREVFHVHSWFVSLTLTIFAIMTWRFSSEMAHGTNPACAWLSGFIGIFWLFRTFLQIFYYSSSHWKGRFDRTLIHIACLIVYGGMAMIYLLTFFNKGHSL